MMEKPKKDAKERIPLYFIEGGPGQRVPVYETNQVMLSFHHVTYDKLVRLMLTTQLSMASMIRMMISPCQKCGHDKVEVPLVQMPSRVGKGPRLTDFHKNNELQDGEAAEHDPLT